MNSNNESKEDLKRSEELDGKESIGIAYVTDDMDHIQCLWSKKEEERRFVGRLIVEAKFALAIVSLLKAKEKIAPNVQTIEVRSTEELG